MPARYREIMFTPEVLEQQAKYYEVSQRVTPQSGVDPLTPDEVEFISRRDSFYMASVTSTGWPYMQHRGGKPGFLRVVSPTRLVFADYKGNRQMISTGNLQANNRVALLLMDYPQRTRLKILGQARIEAAEQHPEWVLQFAEPEARRFVERLFFIEVVSYDWNCPQYITPRYTAAEIEDAVLPLQRRIAELEAELKKINSPDRSQGQ